MNYYMYKRVTNEMTVTIVITVITTDLPIHPAVRLPVA
jgi:hypothetical protein